MNTLTKRLAAALRPFIHGPREDIGPAELSAAMNAMSEYDVAPDGGAGETRVREIEREYETIHALWERAESDLAAVRRDADRLAKRLATAQGKCCGHNPPCDECKLDSEALAAHRAAPDGEAGETQLWECNDCGFRMDARHVSEGSDDNCPSCEVDALKAELEIYRRPYANRLPGQDDAIDKLPITNDSDWRAKRCGHNYEPQDCTQPVCGFRDALADLAAARRERDEAFEIINNVCDGNPCNLDHHGYCQEHCWLDESECPHKAAKRLLNAHRATPRPGRDGAV